MGSLVEDALREENDNLNAHLMALEESVNDLSMRLDTVGWVPADAWNDDSGLSLEDLKRTSKVLKDMVAQSPLIKRAVQLRHGYVFGRGMHFVGTKPRHTKIMDEPYNKRSLFSTMAYEELMTARMTDGNIFVLKDNKSDAYHRVPLDQITGVVTDPDDNERVWYIQRTWTQYNAEGNNGKQKIVWYPVSMYAPGRGRSLRTQINNKPVDSSKTMHFMAFNRQVGFTFGIPDGYAAIVWTQAYSEYLKNNSKLVKAYSTIAYKVSTRTQGGANNVAAQIARPGVAGTAIMGQNQDLAAMPRAGSEVSFENGRPLASLVAASLGVSVVALLSDPGAAGSSYGSAQTLDAPTIIVMTAIQDGWKAFYEEIFRMAKGDSVTVEFPSIETDPVYRQFQSLHDAYQTGAINQQEYRRGVLDLFDIVVDDPDTLPVPDNFNAGHLTPKEAQAAADKQAQVKLQYSSGRGSQTGSDRGETNNDNRTDTQTSGDNA